MTLAALIERIDAEWEKRDFCNELPDYVGISEDEWGAIRDALPVWRPIESAPKDGSHFLAYERVEGNRLYPPRSDDVDRVFVSWWWFGDGLNSARFANTISDIGITYWMPLPRPPEEA